MEARFIMKRVDCGNGHGSAYVGIGPVQIAAEVDLDATDGTPNPQVILQQNAVISRRFYQVGTPIAVDANFVSKWNSRTVASDGAVCKELTRQPKPSPTVTLVLDSTTSVNFRGKRENVLRGFDHPANRFGLNLVEGIAEIPVGDFLKGVVDVGVGENALLTQSAGLFAGMSVPIDLFQAYIELRTHGFHLSVGKRVTTAGMEVIRSDQNANVSRSWMFHNAIPYTDTGLRVGYGGSVADFTLGVNTGWDKVVDNNGVPALLVNLSVTPHDTLTVGATLLASPEKDDNKDDWRVLGDFVLVWKPSDIVHVGFNYDHGVEKNGSKWQQWKGAAGYLAIHPTDLLSVVLREEYFQDDGSRLALGAVEALGTTAGVNFHIVPGLDLRSEVRWDHSLEGPVFADQHDQQTVAAQVIFSY